jgi:glutathione S-transferase
MSNTLKLIATDYCPFCLRCLYVLSEKGLQFDVENVDLLSKSNFLSELSPYTRVPVLVHGEARIFESSVINEYLEDAFPETPLLPRDPAVRANARFWVDFCNTRFMPTYFNLVKSKPGPQRTQLKQQLLSQLELIENKGLQIAGPNSPFWLSDKISLVDFAFYPFFERFCTVEEFRDTHIVKGYIKLRAWLDAMKQQASVARYARTREELVAYFGQYYADGTD